jgi:molecular chaperone HscB
MARIVPSRQALRHLARLCEDTSSIRSPLCAALRGRSNVSMRARRFFSTSRTCAQEDSTATSSSSLSESTSNIPPPPIPDTTNYYTLFASTLPSGPPPAGPFNIPLPALRREFLSLQSLHHPDKFPPSSPLHAQSRGLSALLNTAYRTLSSPLLRAQYLLQQQHDIDVTSEDNSINQSDQETLMEVMEAQEAVEEAANEEEIEALKRENQERTRETEERVAAAFEKGDIQEAKRETVRLKYWASLGQVLHEWEPGKEVRLVH